MAILPNVLHMGRGVQKVSTCGYGSVKAGECQVLGIGYFCNYPCLRGMWGAATLPGYLNFRWLSPWAMKYKRLLREECYIGGVKS